MCKTLKTMLLSNVHIAQKTSHRMFIRVSKHPNDLWLFFGWYHAFLSTKFTFYSSKLLALWAQQRSSWTKPWITFHSSDTKSMDTSFKFHEPSSRSDSDSDKTLSFCALSHALSAAHTTKMPQDQTSGLDGSAFLLFVFFCSGDGSKLYFPSVLRV